MSAANLALRFALELAALAGWAALAWSMAGGVWRYVCAAIAVLAVAALWGVFAVPGDPSRSGNAPVPVPGAVRLALELVILLGGAWAWSRTGQSWVALGLGVLVVLHYLASMDRITWLLRQ